MEIIARTAGLYRVWAFDSRMLFLRAGWQGDRPQSGQHLSPDYYHIADFRSRSLVHERLGNKARIEEFRT